MTARPPFIPRTEERELHQCGNLLERHKDALWYATEKLDGFSFSFGRHNGEFIAANRDRLIASGEDSVFGEAIRRMDLATCFLGQDIIVQGELVGPGIRGNRYNLDRLRFFVFNVMRYDKFLSIDDAYSVVDREELEFVPLIGRGIPVENFSAIATMKSTLNRELEQEGAVIRPTWERPDEFQRVSFKVFNPRYPFHH